MEHTPLRLQIGDRREMEVIVASGMQSENRVSALMKEGNELISIFVASLHTAQKRLLQRSKNLKSAT